MKHSCQGEMEVSCRLHCRKGLPVMEISISISQ